MPIFKAAREFRLHLKFPFSSFAGVYVKTENATYLGLYSVKMIGWGIENGIDYWLMLSSWGTSWGNNGMFKIRKGTGECYVDTMMSAGVPEVGPNS